MPQTNAADALIQAMQAVIASASNDDVATLRARIDALESRTTPEIHIHTKAKPTVVIPPTAHPSAAVVTRLAQHGQNVLLVGPAGCGKTTLAKDVAAALSLECTIVSLTAGVSESALLGRLVPGQGGNFEYRESPFLRAYRSGGLILLDELDAADPNTLLILNSALANGAIGVDIRPEGDSFVKRHENTIIIAAANTWGNGASHEYAGRAQLDASTLDRFYTLALDYDNELESKLASAAVCKAVHNLRTEVRKHKLRRVVSTRMLSRVQASLDVGLTMSDAIRQETVGWTESERKQVGVI